MKKIIFTLILITLMFAALNAAGVGLLTAAKGKVTLHRASKSIKFKVGDSIQNKDEIRTKAESFAAYKYIDDSCTIKVFSNSYVLINTSQSGNTLNKNLKVNSGNVYTQVKPNSKGSVKITTPTTVASVKGTEFLTRVNDDGEVSYIVAKGTVNVVISDTGESSDVNAGQTASVGSDLVLNVRETSQEDIESLEAAEQEALAQYTPNILRIPMVDEDGNIKTIEIEY